MAELNELVKDVKAWLARCLENYAGAIEMEWGMAIYKDTVYFRNSPAHTTGRLVNGISSKLNTQLALKSLSAEVGNDTPYSEYVETGMPPNPAVSFEEIYDWAEAKNKLYGWGISDINWFATWVTRKLREKGYSGWYHLMKLVEGEKSDQIFENYFDAY